jgi:hypothetical protein
MRRTYTNYSLRWLVIAGLVSVAASGGLAYAQPTPSAADLAQARPLLNQAFKLREQGDFAGALEKFKAAHSLAETPITGAELGRAYMAVGKFVEARETFLSVGRIPHRSAETERSVAARTDSAQLAEQLRPRIPSVTIKVVGVPESSLTVTIDGAAVPVDALASPRFLNPGTHELLAAASGRQAEEKVELKEGEARDVVLKIELSQVPVAPHAQANPSITGANIEPIPATAPPAPRGQAQRVLGLVIAGAGVAGLGVGGILGLVAKSQDSSAASETFPAKHNDSLGASHLADAATIVVGVGGAVAVIGGVLWLTAPRTQTTVGTNGTGIWLRGKF